MAKVTKRDKFVEIAGILEGVEGAEDLVDFVAGEVALIDKRASRPRKPTADQLANEVLKDEIVEFLETAGEGVTATDVAKGFDVSTQKVSQLLRQLVLTGRVERVEGKGKTKTIFKV